MSKPKVENKTPKQAQAKNTSAVEPKVFTAEEAKQRIIGDEVSQSRGNQMYVEWFAKNVKKSDIDKVSK